MKFVITRANNGWIVRFISNGLSPLREPYSPGVYVFVTVDEAFNFIKEQDEQ